MNNQALARYLDDLLQVDNYRDYAPNGLQVEGKKDIKKIIGGVTASMQLIERAIEQKADALLVHHGYFWKGENQTITGMKQQRIKALLAHDINLYAYHLPLDGHRTLGNNAWLAKCWHIQQAKPASSAVDELMWVGELQAVSAVNFAQTIAKTLGREPQVITAGQHPISRLAWCSGGAQGFLETAAALGVDAYISGEASEKTYHEAKEYGLHYFAAGHHATERGGIMALTEYLNQHTELSCQFIDCYNPF